MENKYIFKIVNGCEYSLTFKLKSTSEMLRVGLNKAKSVLSVVNKSIKKVDMPEYFEVPENMLNILKIQIRKEVKNILRQEHNFIFQRTGRNVLLIEPTLKSATYKKTNSNELEMNLELKGLWRYD